MKIILGFTALAEAATGLALLILPSLVSLLLFGTGLSGISIIIARVTGAALLGLGIACWPRFNALCGMLTYSALVTLYFCYIGIRGELVGPLLWPAAVLHLILTLLLLWARSRTSPTSRINF